MKQTITLLIAPLFVISCSSFQAERVGERESDERAMEITDKWVQGDSKKVVEDIMGHMGSHKGFRRYLRNLGRPPVVFVGEIQNFTDEAYFPINEINNELLNALSLSGEFLLVDAAARQPLLEEITYQHDGMVDASTSKRIGNQVGADLMIFGSVGMQTQSRKGRTIKQYSVDIRMTDIERGLEVLRTRSQLSKYSTKSAFGW